MTRLARSFPKLPVLVLAVLSCAAAACGGLTVGVDPERTATDAGPGPHPTGEPDSGSLPPSSPPSSVDASTGVSCTTSAACSDGQECAWPVTEDVCIAFNPAGSCVTPLALACNAVEEVTGCGCNGQNVTWSSGCVGLPSGWAPIGLAHAGACEAPVPPTPVDASGPTPIVTECQTGSDCGAGSVCLNTDPLQTPSGTCVANPCGSETLSCGCAASLCTSIGPCDISSPGTVECLSEG